MFVPLVNKLYVVGVIVVDVILVEPPEPALNAAEPVSFTISVSNGIVPTTLAVTPVESKTTFVDCITPLVVDAEICVDAKVTKVSLSLKSANVADEAYKGLNNPLTEDEMFQAEEDN